MTNMETDKASASHVDAIETANSSDHNVHLKHVNSANEEIVQHLQTTGEEVGMTWRSFMAAAVCSCFRPRGTALIQRLVYGYVLQRVSLYPLNTTVRTPMHETIPVEIPTVPPEAYCAT